MLSAARQTAQQAGVEGWRLTLHAPSYVPAMQYLQDRQARQALYHAYVTRASEHGPAERDNTALMQELLALRQEEAALLGYTDFAALSLVPKMARSAQEVSSFLRDLAARSPHARRA